MRIGTKWKARWCCVMMIAFSSSGLSAWGAEGKDRSDLLCVKAETSEKDASEAERKSEERQRFLKGRGGISTRSDTLPSGDTAAIRQSLKAKIAEISAILPQLRQGAASASHDSGVVPGLGQFFVQMDSTISRTLQAAEACLAAPQYCSIPSISCPSMPAMPVFNSKGPSANFTRQIQQSYLQSANQFRQVCQGMNAGLLGDVERLKKESRPAGTMGGLPGNVPVQPFGDTDLQLRRAENLRREASQYRLEADRISGIPGYCGARSHFRIDAKTSHAIVDSLKASERPRKPAADFPLDAKVIDLKSEWEKKWNKGSALTVSGVPLPKLETTDGGKTVPNSAEESSEEDGPSWWDKKKSEYQKADEEMALTVFFTSRPKQMGKFLAKEVVKLRFGAPGESLVNAYTILDAVKTTSDEVGEILVAAPGVITHGSVAEAMELAGRAERVPLNLINNLFDDVTDWMPAPRYGTRKGVGR